MAKKSSNPADAYRELSEHLSVPQADETREGSESQGAQKGELDSMYLGHKPTVEQRSS